MASSLSAFASPLGPLHFAPPSSMSTYSLTSIFRTPKASTSSASAKAPPAPKRPQITARTLQISSPIYQNPPYSDEGYCEASRASPPPPPYRREERRTSAMMGTERELNYAELAEAGEGQTERKERLSIEEMQGRLEQWESERIEKKWATAMEQDRRMSEGLRSLGL